MAESIRMHAAATFYGEREWQPDGRRWLEDALWARVQVRYLIFSPLGPMSQLACCYCRTAFACSLEAGSPPSCLLCNSCVCPGAKFHGSEDQSFWWTDPHRHAGRNPELGGCF